MNARHPATVGRWLAALATAALLAACSSPKPPSFHTLVPPADAGAALPASATPFRIVAVRLPPQVDREQWVLRRPDGGLQVLEQTRWASSLGDEWRAGLSDALQREGGVDLGHGPGEGAVRVLAELQRFESEPGRQVLQQVLWTLRPPGEGAMLSCLSRLAEPAGPSIEALAEAHRRLLRRLAQTMAPAMRALREGRPAACP